MKNLKIIVTFGIIITLYLMVKLIKMKISICKKKSKIRRIIVILGFIGISYFFSRSAERLFIFLAYLPLINLILTLLAFFVWEYNISLRDR